MNCSVCSYPNRPTAHFCSHCAAPLTLQNKYHITRLLGRGGFAPVYLAEHLKLVGVYYAIKELVPVAGATLAELQGAEDQFRLEAGLLAKLSHPMLPKVWDYFSENNRYYLVMEFVEGDTLEDRLNQTNAPLPEVQVLRWGSDLCDVLEYLHSQQPPVIHRDVNPRNIKITPEGKLRLIDFGIAKVLMVGMSTGSAARAVSPPYSPMEQYGTGTTSTSDIYALGATLYHLITNQLPTDAPDRAIRDIVPPRQINPAISGPFEAVVLKAMAQKAADRFQSAAEMKDALPYLPTPAQAPARIWAWAKYVPKVSFSSLMSRWRTVMTPPLLVGTVVLGVLVLVALLSIQESFGSNGALATEVARANATIAAYKSDVARANGTVTVLAATLSSGQGVSTAEAAEVAKVQGTMTAQALVIAQDQAIISANRTDIAQADAMITMQAQALSRTWWIAISRDCAGTVGGYEIYALRANGADLTRLTNNSSYDGDTAISPDGLRIAFASERDGDREIYLMNIDGTAAKRLTYSPGWDGTPDWSPSGKQIAFTSWRSQPYAVHVMNDDGPNIRQITSGGTQGDWMPSWSPDGKQIVFASWIDYANRISELFVVNSDGIGRTQITALSKATFGPRWSPDGRQILFYSDLTGTDQVYVMNRDGSGVKMLTSDRTRSQPIRWSPDGGEIVFERSGGVYIMNVDGSNGRLLADQTTICSK